MNVTPLALHSPRAVRDALRCHGWDEALADTAADSLNTVAFHLTGLDQDALEALVPFAGGLGLEILTGDSWAILAGSRSRVSALARQEIIHGRRISTAETIEKIEAANVDDLQRVAREFFTSESLALGALGKLNGFRVDRSRLKI